MIVMCATSFLYLVKRFFFWYQLFLKDFHRIWKKKIGKKSYIILRLITKSNKPDQINYIHIPFWSLTVWVPVLTKKVFDCNKYYRPFYIHVCFWRYLLFIESHVDFQYESSQWIIIIILIDHEFHEKDYTNWILLI